MFRRFLPAVLILLCFLLDTTVMPVVYTGIYGVPLTVVCVFCIGMVLGRMRGLLYGTMGGLLLANEYQLLYQLPKHECNQG